jgi:type IV pilus assembly protein PilA
MNDLISVKSGKKNLIKKQGFTLIEILVVIGIIAVLALIVLVAVNPARQFALARNTQRTSNVEAILNAVGQRMVDNKGIFNGTTGCAEPIPTTASSTITVGISPVPASDFDLGCLVPTYISSVPYDPSTGSASNTGYTILADSNGRVTVCAPGGVEPAISGSAPICITR